MVRNIDTILRIGEKGKERKGSEELPKGKERRGDKSREHNI